MNGPRYRARRLCHGSLPRRRVAPLLRFYQVWAFMRRKRGLGSENLPKARGSEEIAVLSPGGVQLTGASRAAPAGHSPTADEKEPQRTGTFFGTMSTYDVPENTRSAKVCRLNRSARQPALREPAIPPSTAPPSARPPTEVHLSNAFRSARFTAPVLLVLGAMNAWTAHQTEDYGSLSTALCLCVCAAGLFGEDLLQRGYRRDRVVLAHVAAHPGAATRRVARAVGAPERVVARNLDRLTDDGLLVLVTCGATPALRSYRLAS